MTEPDETGSQRRKGRPPGKRGTFTFRVTPGLRSRLEAAASESERPVSEEVERRLERSFEDADLLLSYFSSTETLKLAQSVSLLARLVENQTGKSWSGDPETKGHLSNAIGRFMNIYFHEQGSAATETALLPLGAAAPGWDAAETVARAMGLRSKAQEEMEAFLATPEGRAAMDRARNATAVSTTK